MPLFLKRTSKKAGAAPGTLVHIGDRKAEHVQLRLIDYDGSRLQERELADIEEALPLKDEPTVTWVNIDGIHDVAVIENIGGQFKLHPLTLEDILNTGQRPKIEDFEDYTYVVFKMLVYDEKTDTIGSEQISLIIGDHFLISFQESKGDVFDPVRERIRKGRGRIRGSGVGYLAYALIDAVVDHYYVVLEKVGEQIESLEEMLLDQPEPTVLSDIHEIKREMIYFRKQVWPMREVMSHLARGDSRLMAEGTRVFFSDVYDHTIHVADTIESYRDVLSGMLDLYLSTASNRMNEVMKVLTIIATIFIPLTFVAGIYGMNFKYMPELEWRYGYFVVWGLMAGVTIGLVYYFKKKKWL